MEAIVYREDRSPEILHLEEVEKPSPKEGGVLVKVLGLPYAPFEFVLGIWLILKGFNSPAIAFEPT
ncbi:MAG: hypothetical protein ACWGOY_04975 [Anaerolineales bacterium]